MSPLAPLLVIALAVASASSPALGEPLGPGGGRAGQEVGAVHRVGYLCEYGSGWRGYLPFVERLEALGYRTDGAADGAAAGDRGARLRIVFRGCAVTEDYLRELARQLVSLRVDVIVAPGEAAVRAAREATRALPIPIVFVGVDDPVAAGFVASLGRPGGTITGVAGTAPEAGARRLALLREAAPDVSRVAVLVNPNGAAAPALLRETKEAARALGLRLVLVEVRDTDGEGLGRAFDRAFSAIGEAGADALLVLPDPLFLAYRGWILGYAWKARLPAIYREAVHAAAETPPGLLSYGPNEVDQHVTLAGYVDKVLRGLDPAALPVARPTTFELVINLGAAARLGLSLPKPLLDRATRIIE